MAKYDLPAMIDYILNQTGSTDMYYAGHSQGTEQAFAGFSQDVELGKKIKTFFALAPVANVTHIISPIRYLAPLAKDFQVNNFFLLYDKHYRLPVRNNNSSVGSRVKLKTWPFLIAKYPTLGRIYMSEMLSQILIHV
jgi:hypothetical protein